MLVHRMTGRVVKEHARHQQEALDALQELQVPHGGLQTFHQKSTCLCAINFRALLDGKLVTSLPMCVGGETVVVHRVVKAHARRRRRSMPSKNSRFGTHTVDYDPFIKSQLAPT